MKSHAVNVPRVVDKVLQKVKIQDIDAIAVTNRPGLNGSLLMGRNYAQYLCYKFKKRKLFVLSYFQWFNLFHYSYDSYSSYGSSCFDAKTHQ